MYRGADAGVLLTDKAFAGSDTLATSYALSCAIRKIGGADLILAGRQAIDGDTAQVGPQVADKLGIPQVTYAEAIVSLQDRTIQIKRRLERGVEVVESTLPVLITAHSTAPECRPRNAKRLMRFKRATTLSERHTSAEDYLAVQTDTAGLITEWCAKDVNSDLVQLGLGGSPTKVRQVENIVFQAKESKVLSTADADIDWLMQELISQHTIG
jgi:electron transfer flavoprotein beta subunit